MQEKLENIQLQKKEDPKKQLADFFFNLHCIVLINKSVRLYFC